MHAIEDLTEGNVLTIEVDSITKIEIYNKIEMLRRNGKCY